MEFVCQICMEVFTDKSDGTECRDGHFLCDVCLNPYLTQNVFPNLYALKRNNCAVNCPATNCSRTYTSVPLYGKMNEHEKARYSSIICNLSDTRPQLKSFKAVFQDILTLKCPCCSTPVDPFPDACSAIMCLSCGNWYCNCCFLGFSDGDSENNRGSAHTHAATHHTRTENRDAFLPAEIVAEGQKSLQNRLLVKCVSLAMSPEDAGGSGCDDAGLALILAAADIFDLNINIVDVWWAADAIFREDDPPQVSLPRPEALSDGGKQMADALKTQNWLACRQLMQVLKDDLNCDYIDEDSGHPITSLALLLRQKAIVVQLLRRGADPLLTSSTVRRTVLYIAIETGMLDVVKLILELNPSIDINTCITQESNGYNLLHAASRYNHGHIVKYLVSKGADMNIKELELGYTPLLLAVVMQNSWAARELIALGSPLNEAGLAGRTSLFILAEQGQVDLLSYGLSDSLAQDIPSVDVNAPICASSQMRLLHVAAIHRQPHVVEFLLSLGARIDINCREKFGFSPLGCAALSKNNVASCLALLQAGADASQPSFSGRSPLYSVIQNIPEIVKEFVTIGEVNVNTRTTLEPIDSLPLTLAVKFKNHHLISTLIELGADVNGVDCASTTALYQAVQLNEYHAAKILLGNGAVPNQCALRGRTPMFAAIENGNTALIRLLVEEHGVDINEVVSPEEIGGGCALHVAAFLDSANATHELLLLGADILKVDSMGRNALDIAKERPTSPVLHILLEHQSTFHA